MSKLSFTLKFDENSTHWVNVVLHSSRSVMRCVTSKRWHERPNNANALCWQANQPGRDNCVAEIHLARTHLDVENITHECCHAAYHRAVLMGVPPANDSFQEWVAGDTGRLVDLCLAFLDRKNVRVNYRVVPGRRTNVRR